MKAVDQAVAVIEQGKQMETAGKVMQGYAFASLQSLQKRDFGAVCDQSKIGRRTAYDYVDLFKLFQRLPSIETIQSVIDLGATKSLALTDWETDDLLALTDGQEVHGLTLDRMEAMTSDELRDHEKARREDRTRIERLERENESLKTDKEALRLQAENAKRDAKLLPRQLKIAPEAHAVRHEAAAMGEQFELQVEHLRNVLIENLLDVPLDASLKADAEIAAGTLFHTLKGATARIEQLMQLIASHFKFDHGAVLQQYTLTPVELELAKDSIATIHARHVAAAKNRDTDRKLAAKRANGGAGRKPSYVEE